MEKYIAAVAEKKMTVGEVCKELGISRQTWYNRLNNKDRVPKKIGRPRKEKVEPEVAPVIDWDAVKAREEAEQREWMLRISDATEWMTEFLNKTFPRLWCKLRFEHVDAAAYWYTFELVNDDRRQTWCVRHSDLEG